MSKQQRTAPPASLTARTEIVGATASELELRVNGQVATVPWSAVLEVNAVMGLLDRTSDRRIMIVSIEVELDGRECLIMLGEVEPMWIAFTDVLSTALPETLPFEVWGVALLSSATPLTLYRRAGRSV